MEEPSFKKQTTETNTMPILKLLSCDYLSPPPFFKINETQVPLILVDAK